jgi:hypothetical protein
VPRTQLSPLLGLAPGGGYLAAPVTRHAGGLLHHLFTLTSSALALPCRAESSDAVCFCGPIRELPRPGVTRHRTLWSPDFPRPGRVSPPGRDHPIYSGPNLSSLYLTALRAFVNKEVPDDDFGRGQETSTWGT